MTMHDGIKGRIKSLYAITPTGLDTASLKRDVVAVLAGGVRLLQYRQKGKAYDLQALEARELNRLCAAYNANLIINDNVRLALEIDAAGVHLGRDDMSVADARRLLGANKIIGVSCYNQIALAEAAVAAGADYIAFGAFFSSQVKPHAVHADLAIIVQAKTKFHIPIVAIGGITLQNAPQLIHAGADAIAVISDLFNAPDITAQARAFQQLFVEKT